jgi:hypothetical protein
MQSNFHTHHTKRFGSALIFRQMFRAEISHFIHAARHRQIISYNVAEILSGEPLIDV